MARLIDADKLEVKHFVQRTEKIIGYDGTQPRYELKDVLAYAIDDAPTVKAIPLDKPFCKMVYGDYVCYNRNWLMNHLPMEVDILQGKAVDAITVEFIEKQIAKYNDWNEDVEPLLKMIEDWRKENEESLAE